MDRSLNQDGILFQGCAGPKIENERGLAGLEHFAQLGHRDARHTQLMQETLTLPVFVGDVNCRQADDQAERAPAYPRDGRADLIDLAAKKITEPKQATAVKQRTDCIHEKKPGSADAGHARQRGRYSVHAGQEFCDEYAAQPVLGKYVLRATDARVRLQGNSAEQTQNLVTAVAPQIKPDRIRSETGYHCDPNPRQ